MDFKSNPGISNCLRQPRHRAKNVGRAPTHLFVSFPMFPCFIEKMHSRTHTNEQSHCELFLDNMHQESTTNQTRWHANEQKIVVWRCLGAVWRGLGAQRARKPTRMHFRMRKPRSWLTLGGCFLVQFVVFFCVFFCCLFVLAPRTVFYGFLCDFELIFDSIS